MNDETFIPQLTPNERAAILPERPERIIEDKRPEPFMRPKPRAARRVGRTVLWLATMGVLGFIATVLWCWLAYRTGMAVDQWLFKR